MNKHKVKGQASTGLEFCALQRLLRKGYQQANRECRPVLVSFSQAISGCLDPLAVFSLALHIGEDRSFWANLKERFWIVGVGRATSININGPERFLKAVMLHREIMSSAIVEGIEDGILGPMFMGGFRFDIDDSDSTIWEQFPDGLLTLPRWIVARKEEKWWVSVNITIDNNTNIDVLESELRHQSNWLVGSIAEPTSFPSARITEKKANERWKLGVKQALCSMESGLLTKVMLARTISVRSTGRIYPEFLLRRLIAEYPECRIFTIPRGDTYFIGATPEELVSLRGQNVKSTCLAGSVSRGDSIDHDVLLAQELLKSDKDRWEHELVTHWVERRLKTLCRDLRWNDSPKVFKLSNIQHLATTFIGVADSNQHVLDFVNALHPTPAVGGIPLPVAMEETRKSEECGRGWYAGPVGWMDQSGCGEFGVAIRSALVKDNEALLYAGAGIVPGSDPESEYRETEMKFRPLLGALGVDL